MDIISDIKEQFRRPNNALVKIILINVIIYLVDCVLFVVSEISHSSLFATVYHFQALPSSWHEWLYLPWTSITYFFSHSISPGHILMNMLGLYWFGYIVQDLVGSRRLISLYILGGLVAGLLFIIVTEYIPFFQERSMGRPLVGASGSVFAVSVAAAVFAPRYEFRLLFLGRIKISYLVIFFIFISFLGTVGLNAGGNVAHLGGAVFGYFFAIQLRQGNDWSKLLFTPWNMLKGLFDKSARIQVSYNNRNQRQSAADKQAEIDAILDKISRSGYESLSKEEKRKLFEASQQ